MVDDDVVSSGAEQERSSRSPGGDGVPDRAGPDLAADLSRLARSLEDEDGLDATLDAIVHAAVVSVPGAEHASISMVRGRREVTSRAVTSDLARKNDRAQYDAGEGPCLESLFERRTVTVPDMAAESRWPVFSERSSGLGVASMLSVQLFVAGDDLGALNLLSTRPHAFDEGSEHIALLFASHAAVAIVGAEQEEQLLDTLAQRDVIGQAMGVLMERYGVTSSRAFGLLTRVSQRNNVRLFELAGEIVARPGEGRPSRSAEEDPDVDPLDEVPDRPFG
ncbi:GAF and ANTAR domain-containing protein [Sanguibacter sp. 25GB23B1]|uniref:GAF and ANTAR domain-containing protein n=1 Tax=unclassified Sanguibacter TaxID=2645534 RepID=UPI0032AEDE0D